VPLSGWTNAPSTNPVARRVPCRNLTSRTGARLTAPPGSVMAPRDGILRWMATRPAWQGFDYDRVDVGDYDALRPDYEPESVDWMIRTAELSDRSPVIELAAGTGKLTRLLVTASLSVVALEPSARMRKVLSRRAGHAVVTAGRAEKIPAGAGSFEAVLVAQAFHHFDAERAAAEIL